MARIVGRSSVSSDGYVVELADGAEQDLVRWLTESFEAATVVEAVEP